MRTLLQINTIFANSKTQIGMNQEQSLSTISQAIDSGHLAEAMQQMQDHVCHYGASASYYCLEGKLHLKHSNWRNAQNAFLRAQALDPQSPASEYLSMLRSIMDFYNKDMYNQ